MPQSSPEWNRLSAPIQRLLLSHQLEAPIKLGELAKDLGLDVSVATLPPRISGEIRRAIGPQSGFAIRINKHEQKARQRFTLAHEISHFLLHKDLIKEELSDDVLYRSKLSNAKEAEANRLASEILMPWHLIDALTADLPNDTQKSLLINSLAQSFEVSEAAMKIRLGI